MARAPKSTSDRIRDLIEASGVSWYRLAKDSGVSDQSIRRFMREEHNLTMASAERVLKALGRKLEIVKRGRR